MVTHNYLKDTMCFGICFGISSIYEDIKTNLDILNIDMITKKRLKEIEKGEPWKPTLSEKIKDKVDSYKAENESPKEEAGAEEMTAEEKEAAEEKKAESSEKDEKAEIIASEAVFREAEEQDEADGIHQFSDDMLDENIDRAIEALPYVDPLKVKLTLLSILYIGYVITPEQIYKRINGKNCMSELEIVNTIVYFYSKTTFYPAASRLMINEVFDKVKDLVSIINYESSYNELSENEALTEIFTRTRELLTEFDKKVKEAQHDDHEPEIPIMFINGNLDFTKPQGLSKQVVNQITKAFGETLNGYSYQFNRINDLIELIIYNTGRMDSYLIDPGTIIGNGYNLIHPVGNIRQFINLKHKDIVAKILSNKLYMLNFEELQRISNDMFTNTSIYAMVDMSKGPEFLPKLSQEEFYKLGMKLSFVYNLPWSSNNGLDGKIPMSRLRFRSFKSVDDFVLVSDDKCKSPLAYTTFNIITQGLVIKVSENKVVVKCGDDYNQTYEIKNYNEM